MADNFYAFLTSNVKPEIGAQHRNKISNFITHLAEKKELTSDYEVSLSEIGFPITYYNVTEEQKFWIQSVEIPAEGVAPLNKSHEMFLPPGNYETQDAIVNAINKIVFRNKNKFSSWIKEDEWPMLVYKDAEKLIKVQYGLVKKVLIPNKDIRKNSVLLFFSEQLSYMMGFVQRDGNIMTKSNYKDYIDLYIEETKLNYVYAHYPFSKTNIHSIYVYSDILNPRIVGNIKAPLFRQVGIPSSKKFGEDCFIKFDNQFYHPLNHHVFDTIQIVLKDDTGKDIDFKYGRVTVTLHFRKNTYINDIFNKALK